MNNSKLIPKVLFFSRSYLAKFFSQVNSELFDVYHVTLTREERNYLENKKLNVAGCFEEQYDRLVPETIESDYLKTSLMSDRFLARFSIKKRLDILGKEISFWRKILKDINPEMIITETVAIEISEVLAIEAERLSIKVHTFLSGFLPNTFYWKPNPFHGSLDDFGSISPNEEDYRKADEYIINVTEKKFKPIYVQGKFGLPYRSIKNLIGEFYRDTILLHKRKSLENKIEFKYEDYYSSNDYRNTIRVFNRYIHKYNKLSDIIGKDYLFYPLHFEPEATLNYFAEEYQSQTNTIETIIRALKPNQYLVVKEHPQQRGVLLDKKYRLLKNKYKNLFFLPGELQSDVVIKDTSAIVTLTSTVAWEALLFSKPVFVLGKIFYDQCPGVIRVISYEDLKHKIRQNRYTSVNSSEVKEFVAKMIAFLKKGCPSPYCRLTLKENTQYFTNAVEELFETN